MKIIDKSGVVHWRHVWTAACIAVPYDHELVSSDATITCLRCLVEPGLPIATHRAVRRDGVPVRSTKGYFICLCVPEPLYKRGDGHLIDEDRIDEKNPTCRTCAATLWPR